MNFILYDWLNKKYQLFTGQSTNQEMHMHKSISRINPTINNILEISIDISIRSGYKNDDSLFEKYRNDYNKDKEANEIIPYRVRD